MILNRIWGLYSQPKTEWHIIDNQHESFRHSLIHLALIALIPTICAYLSTTLIGWNLGYGNTGNIMLTPASAFFMCVSMYFALIAGVFALAYLVLWMSRNFGAKPSFSHGMELAAYAATPLLMAGLVLLYPEPILVMAVGLIGLAYSTYLLHSGIPIVMRIPAERSFIYALSLLTAAWVLLLCAVVAAILLWSWALMYLR